MDHPRTPPLIWSDGAAQPWQVMTPRVFRYENHEHIDEFFATGRLRLSTFQTFGSYGDEARGDQSEGRAISRGIASNNREVWMVHSTGINSFVYCTSQLLSRSLMETFDRSHAFEISDTTSFGRAVGEALGQDFLAGMEGACIYHGERTIHRALNREVHTEQISMEDMWRLAQDLGGQEEMLFLKMQKHRNQQEYRLTWAMKGKVDGAIFVNCPKAVKYCRRIDLGTIPN